MKEMKRGNAQTKIHKQKLNKHTKQKQTAKTTTTTQYHCALKHLSATNCP